MVARSSYPIYVCLMVAAFICIMQINNSLFPEVMEPFTEQSKSSTKPKNRIQKPKFLAEGKRNETRLLVHVGKAGGSSIRTQIERSQNVCRTKPQSLHHCSLGRVARVTHMVENLYIYPQYSHFLIPIRNPVDRLISWFNYERHLYWVVRNRFAIKNENLRTLTQSCFTDVDALITQGLATDLTNQTTCQKLARACLIGEVPCYAHNFYNYEVYLEDLIRWRECGSGIQANCTGRDIRIDVLRSEHSDGDMNRVLELWTGEKVDTTWENKRLNSASTIAMKGTKNVSAAGIERLCRTICPELIAYKKILEQADNLRADEVEETYQELDQRCGLSVDETCGTDFQYRGIKKEKKIRDYRKRYSAAPKHKHDEVKK